MKKEYAQSFALTFSALNFSDFTNAYNENIYEQIFKYIKVHSTFYCYFSNFQELHHCCIRLQVVITLYQNNSRLSNSLNFLYL